MTQQYQEQLHIKATSEAAAGMTQPCQPNDSCVSTAASEANATTGVTGTSARRSGCLAVIADATVSCGASYTAIAKLAVVLYCYC